MILLYIIIAVIGLFAVMVILAAMFAPKEIHFPDEESVEYDTTDYTDNEEEERL